MRFFFSWSQIGAFSPKHTGSLLMVWAILGHLYLVQPWSNFRLEITFVMAKKSIDKIFQRTGSAGFVGMLHTNAQ